MNSSFYKKATDSIMGDIKEIASSAGNWAKGTLQTAGNTVAAIPSAFMGFWRGHDLKNNAKDTYTAAEAQKEALSNAIKHGDKATIEAIRNGTHATSKRLRELRGGWASRKANMDKSHKSAQRASAFFQGLGSTVIPVQSFWDALDSKARYGQFDPGNRMRTRLMQQRMGLSPEQLQRYNSFGKHVGNFVQLAAMGSGMPLLRHGGALGGAASRFIDKPIGALSRGLNRIAPKFLTRVAPKLTPKAMNMLSTIGVTAGFNTAAGVGIDQLRSWALGGVRDEQKQLQAEKKNLSPEQYAERAKSIRLKKMWMDTAAGTGKTLAGLSLLPSIPGKAPAKAAGNILARGAKAVGRTAGNALKAWVPAGAYMASQSHERDSYGKFGDTGNAAIDAKRAQQAALQGHYNDKKVQEEWANDQKIVNKILSIPRSLRTPQQNAALDVISNKRLSNHAMIGANARSAKLNQLTETRARHLLDRGYGGQGNMLKSSLTGTFGQIWPQAVSAGLFGNGANLGALKAMGLSTLLTNPSLFVGGPSPQTAAQLDKRVGYLNPLLADGKVVDPQLMSALQQITAEKMSDAMIGATQGAEPAKKDMVNQLKVLQAVTSRSSPQQRQQMIKQIVNRMQNLDAQSALTMVRALDSSSSNLDPNFKKSLVNGLAGVIRGNLLQSISQGDFSQVAPAVRLWQMDKSV